MSSTDQPPFDDLSRQDKTLLLFARLMEGGKEDEETVASLDTLTGLLNDDPDAVKKGEQSIVAVIDADCLDTILGYLDMRQAETVRAHATLCTSAFLNAAGDHGRKMLSEFFLARIRRSTYDDYIVAFCVATAMFPVVPDLTSELFLTEGFLPSLGPLMRRKFKSRKVETACLEMLNAACMHAACREAVERYCIDWLEEIVDQDPDEVVCSAQHTGDPDVNNHEGSLYMRRHSQHVQNLAAVVLAKLRAVPKQPAPKKPGDKGSDENDEPRVQQAETSIEDLSKRFSKMLVDDPDHAQVSVEGLAYASLQSKVKEELSQDKETLKRLVRTLEKAPPKSPLAYGALSIFVNLTRYLPRETEEQEKLRQLKAYADAAGKLQPDSLMDDAHVAARCKRVFEAGITPVLAIHSKESSVASLTLIISILHSISVTQSLRGQLAQQGAVRVLLSSWSALPEKEALARRTAAQALARILISINPALVFGGSRPVSQTSAVRPLTTLLTPDDSSDTRDLLPTFESLLALTNLASTDHDTRRTIVRAAWDKIEELLFNSNSRVSTAAAELVCNIVQAPEQAHELFADEEKNAVKCANRVKVMLALCDAEDPKARSAAGGAMAALTQFEFVVKTVIAHPRGVDIILGLCREQDDEGLRHRGAVIVGNMVTAEGDVGKAARDAMVKGGAVQVLVDCAKRSRTAEVVQACVGGLEVLMGKGE